MINFVEFTGNGNAKEWITKFEFQCEVNRQELGGRTKENLIQYALSGDAFEWFSDHIEGRNLGWTEIKGKFLSRFGVYRSQASDVVIVAQGSMNVREYCAIFSRKAVALGSLTVTSMISCFIRGLNPNLRHFLMSSRPNTFDEAVDRAYEYEAYLLESSIPHIVPPVPTPIPAISMPREEHRPGRGPNRTLVCYNCQENGHLSRDCPKKRSADVRMVQYEDEPWEVFTTRRSVPDLKVEKPEVKRHNEHAGTPHFKKMDEEKSTGAPMNVEHKPEKTQFESASVNDASQPPVDTKPVAMNLTKEAYTEKLNDDKGKDNRKLGEIVERYDVIQDLMRAKADISFGQLLAVSSEVKQQLQVSLKRTYHSRNSAVRRTDANPVGGVKSKIVEALLNQTCDCRLIIDSGAEVNILSKDLANRLRIPLSSARNLNLRFADGNRSWEIAGTLSNLQVEVLGHQTETSFVVLEGIDYEGLLGLPWLVENGVVTDWKTGELKFQESDDDNSMQDVIDGTDGFAVRIVSAALSNSDNNEEESIPEAKPLFKAVLQEFKELFVSDLKQLKKTHVIEHQILTSGGPIKKKPYRLRREDAEFVQQQVQTLIDNKMIEAISSPWSFPLVVVTRNLKKRMCVDFTALNRITKKDNFPLPNTEDLLIKVGSAQVMSTLDLFSGFWQIPLATKDQEKATFITPEGTYCFTVMPFGLCNAPATFQRMMNNLLGDLKFVAVYIDDIIIFSNSETEHCEHLREVLKRIEAANLSISGKKCTIAVSEVKFLGYIIGHGTLKPDPKKVEALSRISPPSNISALRSFLGLVRFYERLIPDFASRALCLYGLLKKDVEFVWNEEHQAAFIDLKYALTHAPIIVAYDPNRKTRLMTDASNDSIGAVVLQEVGPEEWRPVAYASRTLSAAEKNYTVTEKECLAIIFALKKFRVYLVGIKFLLQTDHRALKFLFQETSATTPQRIVRWIIQLSEFDFDVEYIEGSKNAIADCLSRLKLDDEEESCGPSVMNVAVSEDLMAIKNFLERPNQQGVPRRIKALARKYVLFNGNLVKRVGEGFSRVIMNKEEQERYLKEIHEEMGHPSVEIMFALMKERVNWPTLYVDVRNFCQACSECRKWSQSGQIRELNLQARIPLGELFECFHLDFIGPLPTTQNGNRFILVAIDRLSRWTILKSCSNPNSVVVLQLLVELVSTYGCPRRIITDNGTAFVSGSIEAFMNEYGIEHSTTAPYMPATNGMCERVNSEIKRYLRRKTGRRLLNWDRELTRLNIYLRAKYHRELGCSPYEIVYGKKMNIPSIGGPLYDVVKNFAAIQENRNQIARNWNEQIRESDNPLQIGDLVMYRTAAELEWSGPYSVISLAGPREVWLSQQGQRPFRAHINQLKVVCTQVSFGGGEMSAPVE